MRSLKVLSDATRFVGGVGNGFTTDPVTGKLNGDSFGSLLVKLMFPVFVPATFASRRTVKVSDAPGRSDVTRPLVMV